MLEPETNAALRRMVEEALDTIPGDHDAAVRLVYDRLHAGTVRDRTLMETIVRNAVHAVLGDIILAEHDF
jgi:hypothetical protein